MWQWHSNPYRDVGSKMQHRLSNCRFNCLHCLICHYWQFFYEHFSIILWTEAVFIQHQEYNAKYLYLKHKTQYYLSWTNNNAFMCTIPKNTQIKYNIYFIKPKLWYSFGFLPCIVVKYSDISEKAICSSETLGHLTTMWLRNVKEK